VADGSDAVIAMEFNLKGSAVSGGLPHFLASTVAIFGGEAYRTAGIFGFNFFGSQDCVNFLLIFKASQSNGL